MASELNYMFSKEVFSELFVVPGRDGVHAFETKQDHKVKETSGVFYTEHVFIICLFLQDLNMTGSSMPAERPRKTIPVKKRRSTDKKPSKKKKSKRRTKRKHAGVSSTLRRQQENRRVNVVPVELLLRFPSALQEINRRIMGQNSIWLALQMDKKTLCFQD